mmetsp:Transcript_6005/g.12265  ORF Transcript_6005/g.12265 Transcript_6005/m.12265 type:complete len:397 (-) Transcript_6005:253-1443(-)
MTQEEPLRSSGSTTDSRHHHHLQQVGVSCSLLLRPMHAHDMVARSHKAVFLGLGHGLGDDGVSAHEGCGEHGDDTAHDLQVPHRGLTRCDRKDGCLWAVLGNLDSRGARFGQCDNELALGVDGCLDGRGANGLDRGHGTTLHDLHASCEVEAAVVKDLLRRLADFAHDGHRLHRVPACRGFAREHDTVTAVQHGVCHVAGLRASGPWRAAHGLQHLRRSDHRLTHTIAMGDHHLLCHKDILRRDLHAQIATCHHDAVAGLGNGREVLHASLVLNLGDDLDAAAAQAQRLAYELHVIRGLHEGRSNKVHAMDNAEVHEVILVLLLQDREVHLDTRQIAILALTKKAIVHDFCHDVVCAHGRDLQREGAICTEDDATLLHRLAELVIAQCKASVVALE